MNCPKCGSPVSKNDEYCGSCGHRLTDNKGVSGGQGPHKKKKKSGILVFAVILEIVAIAFIVVMVLRGFPDKKAEDDKPNRPKNLMKKHQKRNRRQVPMYR